jgi:chromosome segregation ATPase
MSDHFYPPFPCCGGLAFHRDDCSTRNPAPPATSDERCPRCSATITDDGCECSPEEVAVAARAEVANLHAQLAAAQARVAEVERELRETGDEIDALHDDIAEHLPSYVLDDGTDEPANVRETIEYAGDEIKRLTSALAAKDAEIERLKQERDTTRSHLQALLSDPATGYAKLVERQRDHEIQAREEFRNLYLNAIARAEKAEAAHETTKGKLAVAESGWDASQNALRLAHEATKRLLQAENAQATKDQIDIENLQARASTAERDLEAARGRIATAFQVLAGVSGTSNEDDDHIARSKAILADDHVCGTGQHPFGAPGCEYHDHHCEACHEKALCTKAECVPPPVEVKS